jgi:hypothetical protein
VKLVGWQSEGWVKEFLLGSCKAGDDSIPVAVLRLWGNTIWMAVVKAGDETLWVPVFGLEVIQFGWQFYRWGGTCLG